MRVRPNSSNVVDRHDWNDVRDICVCVWERESVRVMRKRESVSECDERDRERECVCVEEIERERYCSVCCVSEWKRYVEYVYDCVSVCLSACVCVCVCVWQRERERERGVLNI